MADQRRIDMKMSGKPEEEAWIQVINGKRANASGGFVKTKADLLKMKKYMGMVTQKVRDAYNKRLAELSKSKSADSIDSIAAKYGHEVKQNDAVPVDKNQVLANCNYAIQYASSILRIATDYKKAVESKNAFTPSVAKGAEKNQKMLMNLLGKLSQFG